MSYPNTADVRREALAMAIDYHRDGGGTGGDVIETAGKFFSFLMEHQQQQQTGAMQHNQKLASKVREWDGASV